MNALTYGLLGRTDVRSRRGWRSGAGFVIVSLAPLGPSVAQCQPVWSAVGPPGRESLAFTLGTHDDDGPEPIPRGLYVGGFIGPSPSIARFDGWSWQSAGEGFEPVLGNVAVRAILDSPTDVPGLGGLVAIGIFSSTGGRAISKGLAQWNGRSWESVGTTGTRNGGLRCAAVFDEDDSGPGLSRLFVSGRFSGIGHEPHFEEFIARWDGVQWSSVGGGFRLSSGSPDAASLCVYDDDGSGPIPPALYAGGTFDNVGGQYMLNLGRWDGTRWTDVGGYHPAQSVRSLAVWDHGTGKGSLFVGGDLMHLQGPGRPNLPTPGGIARWDGKQWHAIPGADGSGGLQAMVPFDDDGPGPNREALFVTGFGIRPGGQNFRAIGKWDGLNWYPLGIGLSGLPIGTNGDALCVFDEDGDGPNPGGIYVAGDFLYAGGIYTPGLARWGCPLPPRCAADCDQSTGPNQLDTFDYLCFLNRYSYEDPWACDSDLSTGPRVCDIFDFLWFQNQFAAGCP